MSAKEGYFSQQVDAWAAALAMAEMAGEDNNGKPGDGESKKGSNKGKGFGNWDEHMLGDGGEKPNSLDGTIPANKPITSEELRSMMNQAEQMAAYSASNAKERAEGKGIGAGNSNQKFIDQRRRTTQPWKTILSRFMKTAANVRSYARLNTRMAAARVVSPHQQKQFINESPVIAIDVSASMPNKTIDKIVQECMSLSKLPNVNSIRILFWDGVVESDITISNGKKTNSIETGAGGGTVIDCVCEYIIKNKIQPSGVCYITDGGFMGDTLYVDKGCVNVIMLTKDRHTVREPALAVQEKYGASKVQIYQSDLGEFGDFNK